LLPSLMHKVLLAMPSSARRMGTDQILTFFLCCYFPVAFVVIQFLSLWVLRQTSNSILFLCLQVGVNCWTWGANRWRPQHWEMCSSYRVSISCMLQGTQWSACATGEKSCET
jgi:hypothetical protein